jgi:Tol biopolymer transport system component
MTSKIGPTRGKPSIGVMLAAALAAVILAAAIMRPAGAAFPGTAGAIAFTSNRDDAFFSQVYRMGSDGFGQSRLSNTLVGADLQPSWSADGGLIAFTNCPFGPCEIYLMNHDGSGEYNLTNDPANDTEPAWFPGGEKIAFRSSRTGAGDIYTANLDASGNVSEVTRITTGQSTDAEPTVSPDGRWIVFLRDNGLWMIKARPEDSTNRPVRLTRSGSFHGEPDWSPGGTQIAFTSSRSGNYEIYRMKAAPEGRNNRPVRLTRDAASDQDPTWSPDGKKIAFVSSQSGNYEIFRMRASDGANQTNLTNDPATDRDPSWQPLP